MLDEGRTLEFDHAHILLQNPSGRFTAMAKHTGDESHLRRLAEEAYRVRKYGDIADDDVDIDVVET